MMAQNPVDERLRLRRVLPERAIQLAMQNRWQEAVDVNRTILKLDPNDADAYNRLGKALLELGQYREAYDAYARAVELSPANAIAQKNMQRLAPLVQAGASAPAPAATHYGEGLRPQAFIEETGKTGLTTLVHLASGPVLLTLTAGDRVDLRPTDSGLEVYTESGAYLGQVEPKLAHRLLRFTTAGNRYSAAVTTVSDKSLTILIREVYQSPAMAGRPSFPARAIPPALRTAFAREGATRYGDDDDDGLGDDYDEDADTDADEPEEEPEFEDDEIDER